MSRETLLRCDAPAYIYLGLIDISTLEKMRRDMYKQISDLRETPDVKIQLRNMVDFHMELAQRLMEVQDNPELES